jgi:phosphopantothenoylcysteine synthetase/decarboxylase
MTRTLYIIGTAAPPVRQLDEACKLAIEDGWQPCVILTPTAADWVDVERLAAITGLPVRVHPRRPDEQDPLPTADAVLGAPLTFNTINKWAAGISDTLALGLLNGLLVGGPPIVAAPCAKDALRSHPAYSPSIRALTNVGVRFLDQEALVSRDTDGRATFNWQLVMHKLNRH